MRIIIRERTDPIVMKKPQQNDSESLRDFQELRRQRSKQVADLLRHLPGFLEAVQEFGNSTQYRVRVSPEAMQGLKTGALKWMKQGNDLIAVVQDSKTNRISEIAGLEKMPSNWMDSVQQLINQQMLMEIISKLDEVSSKLSDVLQGQHDDRRANLVAGMKAYRHAVISYDPANRNSNLSEARDKLRFAKELMLLQLKNSIEKFSSTPNLNSEDAVKTASHMQDCYLDILRTSQYLVLVFDAQGETESVQDELTSLRQFVVEFGANGARISRELPYNKNDPPEELWRKRQVLCAEYIDSTLSRCEHPDQEEFVIESSLITTNAGGKDEQ